MAFLNQTDPVGAGVALFLLAMSLASWYAILDRLWSLARERAGRDAGGTPEARLIASVRRDARRHHEGGREARMDRGEFVRHAAAHALARESARLEAGLTRLAAVGATAPFVGLLGTVWGVHKALANLAEHERMSLAVVAGPVAEALVMTAAGLAVAIPAVLAYNAFVRANRKRLARLADTAHGLFVEHATGHDRRLGHDADEIAARDDPRPAPGSAR
jgi:biopolymer transport protein ExbB